MLETNALRTNNERFAELIYSLPVFTEEELLNEYRKKFGNETAIEGNSTITECLEDLTQIGILRYFNGKYVSTNDT